MAQQAFIQFDKVSKEYGSGDRHFYALKDATFSIQQGEMVVILGPSGAGKSTLLNGHGIKWNNLVMWRGYQQL